MTLTTHPSATVKSIHRQIYQRDGMTSLNLTYLIHEGKQLYSDRTLADYGIKNVSTVYMVLRLRGGQ